MKRILLALTVATSLIACEKNDKHYAGTFKSPPAKFQHGKSWSWIEMDDANKPVKIGISIDDEAMSSLQAPQPGHGGGHEHTNSVSIKIPSRNSEVPFQHIMLDWSPEGHEPAGIFDQPHFDFHFYLTSEAERLAIPAYPVDSLKFKSYPAPAYMPALYVPTPGGVPQMGAHWVDVTSPELNGQLFTQTFIYGTYNGQVNFYEPMITKAFLDANPNFERAIPTPVKFQKTGYYPTKMKVTKATGATHITLENFVYRTQS